MNRQLLSRRIWRIFSVSLLLGVCLSTASITPVSALDASTYFDIVYETVLSLKEIHSGDRFSLTVTSTVSCTNDLPLSVSEASIKGKVVAKHTESGDIVVLKPDYNLTINPFPKAKGDSLEQSVVLDLSFPSNSLPGKYNIYGDLIEARVKALLWFTVTEYLPQLQEFASVIVLPKSEPVVNPAPESPDSSVHPAATYFSGNIDRQGNVMNAITVISGDGNCVVRIPAGAKAFNKDGLPLPEITITPISNPPSAPLGNYIIGFAYELAPEKAIFTPSAMLSLSFEKSQIPEGSTPSSLIIATYDQTKGIWVALSDIILDKINLIISSPITHFSLYAVLSPHSLNNNSNPTALPMVTTTADSSQSLSPPLPGEPEPIYTPPTIGKPGSELDVTRIPTTTIIEVPPDRFSDLSTWLQIVFIVGVNLVLITIIIILWKSRFSTHR